MNTNTRIKLNHRQSAPIISRTFPEYIGRKVFVEFTEKVGFYDLYWGDGTRNVYKFIQTNGNTFSLPRSTPWDDINEGKWVDLPADILIVKHAIFCGHDCGITIYANPIHAPKWLPEGAK